MNIQVLSQMPAHLFWEHCRTMKECFGCSNLQSFCVSVFVGIHTQIQVVGSEQNNEIAEISLLWGLAGLSLTGWVICLAIWKGFTSPDWLGWLLDASLVRHFGTNGCVILWIMEWNQNTKLRKCKLTGPQLPEGSDPDLCCCACAQKYNNCYFFFFFFSDFWKQKHFSALLPEVSGSCT